MTFRVSNVIVEALELTIYLTESAGYMLWFQQYSWQKLKYIENRSKYSWFIPFYQNRGIVISDHADGVIIVHSGDKYWNM